MARDLDAVTVAMVQMRVEPGLERRETNLQRAVELIEVACKGKHIDVVALPETFTTGFPDMYRGDSEEFLLWAERLPSEPGERPDPGTTLGVLAEIAQEREIFIQAGTILEADDEGRIHNTAALLDDQGRFLGKYSKLQPWVPEPGGTRDLFTVCDTTIGVIGMNVCYDGSFPEISRILSLKGAEIIFRPSEINDPLTAMGWEWWQIENRARAIENHCYVVAVSCVKQDDIFTYPGCSMLTDPYGRVVIGCGDSAAERVLVGEVNVNEVRRIRRTWPSDNHLRDMRIDLYAREYMRLAATRADGEANKAPGLMTEQDTMTATSRRALSIEE